MAARPIRVIQWTTGNIGARSLHAILIRPDMELVGVYAYSADKTGKDAAELCGHQTPTGVTATDDIEKLIALKPDACAYNPLWSDVDELCRLLEAGINVCSTAGWITGGKLPRRERERVVAAAERGNATIFDSGAHPGMTNLLGIVTSAACERVDHIKITESVDCSMYASGGTMSAMGFGKDPADPDLTESLRRASEVFAESAAMMGDALGVTFDRITFDATFTPASGDSDLGFMKIPAGTVAAIAGYHRGWIDDRNIVSVGFTWLMGDQVEAPFKLYHGHVIQVFGSPNFRTVAVALPPKGVLDYMSPGMIYTALPALNAIPHVVAAKPGIVTFNDLPMITGPVFPA